MLLPDAAESEVVFKVKECEWEAMISLSNTLSKFCFSTGVFCRQNTTSYSDGQIIKLFSIEIFNSKNMLASFSS